MINKASVLFITLVMVLCSSCDFNPLDECVDGEKSEFYYYTALKRDVVYKYRQSIAGIPVGWTRIKLGADPKSFVVLGKYYAKDRDNCYYVANKFNADAETLVFVEGDYCKDKNSIYFKGIKVTNADFATFTSGKDFMRDKTHLFRDRFTDKEKGILMVVEGANPDTFEKLGNSWSKDDSHYFYYYEKVDVDYNTFRLLTKDIGIDKDQIHYFAGMPSYGHGRSYKHTGEVHYTARNVFYDNKNIYNFRVRPVFAIPINNPATIQLVDTTRNIVFFVDKKLYWNMKEKDASNIDAATFKTDGNYATDKNKIYYSGIEINGTDRNTFEKIDGTFSKDLNHVYNKWEIFPGADPATFKYVIVRNGPNHYQDKSHKWKYNSKEKAWEAFE